MEQLNLSAHRGAELVTVIESHFATIYSRIEALEKRKVAKRDKIDRPESYEVFEAYFIEKGYRKDIARRAYDGYEAAGWRDSKGDIVRCWKQKCQSVWFRDENRIREVELIPKSRPKTEISQIEHIRDIIKNNEMITPDEAIKMNPYRKAKNEN